MFLILRGKIVFNTERKNYFEKLETSTSSEVHLRLFEDGKCKDCGQGEVEGACEPPEQIFTNKDYRITKTQDMKFKSTEMCPVIHEIYIGFQYKDSWNNGALYDNEQGLTCSCEW